GQPFDPKAEAANQRIVVTVIQEGIVVGGMTYVIDPRMDRPGERYDGNGEGHGHRGHTLPGDGKELLRFIDLEHARVRAVSVRKVILEVDFCEDD
ncbi:MAG TPA: hypothetical protein VK389_00350, partial [Thermoanaerobaculia bacterium]|nr:hypothetical protein [Thermoanaerobaculia bacterium]